MASALSSRGATWGAAVPRHRLSPLKPLGLPFLHLRARRQSANQNAPSRVRSSSASAVQHDEHHEAHLSAVDEMPDGTVVMHFSEDDSEVREHVEEVVSYLTRPASGKASFAGGRKKVPKEVLEDLVGDAVATRNPVASFMKGMLYSSPATPTSAATPSSAATATSAVSATSAASAAHTNGGAAAAATARRQASGSVTPVSPPPTPAAAAAAPIAGTAGPTTAARAPAPVSVQAQGTPRAANAPSVIQAPPKALVAEPPADAAKGGVPRRAAGVDPNGTALDVVRVAAVAFAAVLAAALLRFAAGLVGVAAQVLSSPPASAGATLAFFAVSFLSLWATGFAKSGKGAHLSETSA